MLGSVVPEFTKSHERKFRVPLPGVKVAVAPLGRPETLRETDWGVPDTSSAETEYEVAWPWPMV